MPHLNPILLAGYHLNATCNLIYLDPHVAVQPALTEVNATSRQTLSECSVLTMPLTSLDPSLVLGFYCKDRYSPAHINA